LIPKTSPGRFAAVRGFCLNSSAKRQKRDVTDINHRRSKRHQSYLRELTVQIGGTNGPIFTFHDRPAWALDRLIEVGESGVTTLDWPAPRWSQYILMFRRHGIAIETILERHDGPYAGLRGRYILRCPAKIIDRKDAA
jgi:hypothetical protein